jgi:predicted transposase YdaD
MSTPYDATFKHLLDHYPKDWLRLAGMDAGTVEVVDADLSTITAHADKVFRVADDQPWMLHVEPQASYEVGLPARVFTYNALIHRRHSVPVHSVVLLLRKEATGPAITGKYRLQLPGERRPYMQFRYGVIRVWQLHAERLLNEGLGTLPLAILADDARPRLEAVAQAVRHRIEESKDPESSTLISAAYILAGLRYPREVAMELFKGGSFMRESDTYQAILEEGIVEGRLQYARAMLLRLGTRRWGPPAAATRQRLEAINDLGQVQSLIDRLLDAGGWDELLRE